MKTFCVVTFFVLIWVFGLKIHGCSNERARAAIYEEVWESSPELKRVHDNLLTELSYLRKERAKLQSLKELFRHEAAIADADRRIRQVENLMDRVQSNLDSVAISVERLALASTSTATSSDLQQEAIESLEASAEEIVKDSELLRAALETGEFPPEEPDDLKNDSQPDPGEPQLAVGTTEAAEVVPTVATIDEPATEPVQDTTPAIEAQPADKPELMPVPEVGPKEEPLPGAAPQREEKPRIWKDVSGNQVTAEFLGIKGLDGEWVDRGSENSMALFQERIRQGHSYSARLRLPNGRVLSVSLRNFSDSDRDLILSYYKSPSPQPSMN